jgi:hypothetical protein
MNGKRLALETASVQVSAAGLGTFLGGRIGIRANSQSPLDTARLRIRRRDLVMGDSCSGSFMNRCLWLVVAAAVWTTVRSPSSGPTAGASRPPVCSARRRDEFIAPAMKKHNLRGPANDVALFRRMLSAVASTLRRHRLARGLPADETARPTRSNIERGSEVERRRGASDAWWCCSPATVVSSRPIRIPRMQSQTGSTDLPSR